MNKDIFEIIEEDGKYNIYINVVGEKFCSTDTQEEAEGIIKIANPRVGKYVLDDKCPSCEIDLVKEGKFCSNCGQYLLWVKE